MALLKEYFKLINDYREKYGENTILMMEVGSFYEVYTKVDIITKDIIEPQIIDLMKYCDLVPGKKSDSVLMLGIPSRKLNLLEKHVEKLINNGYTVVVYNQDGPTNNPTRSLTAVYSPGTYFKETCESISNNMSCIWIESHKKTKINKYGNIVIGMSNIDNFTGKSNYYEIVTENLHNPTTYDELERFISIYNPKECIIVSNHSDKELNDIMNYIKLDSKKHHLINKENTRVINAEKQTYQREILEKFFSFNISESLFKNSMEYTYALQSYVFLLNFVYEHNPSLVNHIQEPIIENNTDRMTLANHSLKQLNIIPDGNYKGKLSSVSSFLNNCITSMGMRSFNYNIFNPITNREKLMEKYNITEYLLKTDIWNNWRTHLKSIKDIEKLNRQIYVRSINPRKLFHFNENLSTIREIYSSLSSDDIITSYLSQTISLDVSDVCEKFQHILNDTFDMDICKSIDNMDFDVNFINVGVNAELDKYVSDVDDGSNKLESIRYYLNSLVGKGEKKTKNDFIKIEEKDKAGISLQCTSRRSVILKKQIELLNDSVKLQYTNSHGQIEYFCFNPAVQSAKTTASNVSLTNGEINELCNNITNSKQKMKDLIAHIYKGFITKLQEYEVSFKNLIQFCSSLDVLQNSCYIVVNNNYCKPVIKEGDKSYVNAKQIRHPLIEKLNTDELYVPNDLSIGLDKELMLLYGTNAVGKTSIIRAVGINIIMAQSGLYVPSEEFEFVPYKSIYTRILGNDNLFKGLSTFAVEMSELRIILNTADHNSLILGDELCSGTEHDSAVSIFVSGLEILSKKHTSAIFATHLHEIIAYDEIESLTNLSIKHMSVQYDAARDILVYDRIMRDGGGTSMYGLEVCKSLHLPDNFLEKAYELRRKYKKSDRGILEQNTSHFNSKKIMGNCELCKKSFGSEVHHLQHQEKADENSMINIFHKNHPANLLTVCDECHIKIHKSKKQHKKIRTSIGIEISEISE